MSHIARIAEPFGFAGNPSTRQTGEIVPQPRRKLERPCGSFRRFRLGAATVEFAVVLPVFLIMVLGMIEFGRAFMVQQVITNASREGARQAVLDGATTSSVQEAVKNYVASGSIKKADVVVEVSPSLPLNPNSEYGAPISVTVKVPFNKVSWLPSPMYLGGKELSAKTVMRRESVQ